MSGEDAYEAFAAGFDTGTPQLVARELVADTQTPVSAYLRLAAGKRNTFLLESVEGGEIRGRFSIIGLAPDLIWRSRGAVAEINRSPEKGDSFTPDKSPPIDSLRALMAESAMSDTGDLPPMATGLFGYFGYDMIRHIEVIPDSNRCTTRPTRCLHGASLIAIFDRLRDSITLVVQIRPAEDDAAAAWNVAQSRISNALQALDAPMPATEAGGSEAVLPNPQSNMARDDFLDIVDRAKGYIRAGDIFQVVLSQRFSILFHLPAINLYRSLRRLNPSPFLFFFDFDDLAIVGSSPEILVRLRDDVVTIRPTAGTRKRGATPEEDAANAEDLMSDVMNAEHLMLLDLGRNDVGRVSRPGTVQEIELRGRALQPRHAHRLAGGRRNTSRSGRGRRDDCWLSCGHRVGAPKIRAMEIIDELEPDKRGVYSGAIGYISAAGDLDTCIALRTAFVRDGKLHVQAGAGSSMTAIPRPNSRKPRTRRWR